MAWFHNQRPSSLPQGGTEAVHLSAPVQSFLPSNMSFLHLCTAGVGLTPSWHWAPGSPKEKVTSSPQPHTQKARRRAGLESRWAQPQLPCMHTHTQSYMHTAPLQHIHIHMYSFTCVMPPTCTHICTHAPFHAPTYACTVKHSYMSWLQCFLPTQPCTKSWIL